MNPRDCKASNSWFPQNSLVLLLSLISRSRRRTRRRRETWPPPPLRSFFRVRPRGVTRSSWPLPGPIYSKIPSQRLKSCPRSRSWWRTRRWCRRTSSWSTRSKHSKCRRLSSGLCPKWTVWRSSTLSQVGNRILKTRSCVRRRKWTKSLTTTVSVIRARRALETVGTNSPMW